MLFCRFLTPQAIVFILSFVARTIPEPRTIDDAFITFRYAQNMISGHGLVYNPGEAVPGTTTPVYALLMTALGLLAGGTDAPFPTISVIVNALADSLTCWLLVKLGEALDHRRAGLSAAIVWAIAPWSVTFAIGGLETSLFVLLMVSTFYLHSTNRPIWAALTAGLCLLTYPLPMYFQGTFIGVERIGEHWKPPVLLTIATSLAFTSTLLGWTLRPDHGSENPAPNMACIDWKCIPAKRCSLMRDSSSAIHNAHGFQRTFPEVTVC